MRLDDHWTPCRKSRSEVVPEHAEGKREVACAEDGDRAERLLHPGQARCGAGRMVGRGSEVGALGGHVAVEAQLTGRTRHLGGEAFGTQRGLYLGQFDQFRRVPLEGTCDRVQPTPPLPRAGCGHDRTGAGRAVDNSPDLTE
jgi:hypothetical protein